MIKTARIVLPPNVQFDEAVEILVAMLSNNSREGVRRFLERVFD